MRRNNFLAATDRVKNDGCVPKARVTRGGCRLLRDSSTRPWARPHVMKDKLFEFYKEQNEDGPNSHGDGKLHNRGVAHGASPGQSVGEEHHCQSGEDTEDQLAFPIHDFDLPFFLPRLRFLQSGEYTLLKAT